MFNSRTNTQTTNTATNQWTTLWECNVPAGSVNDQDALQLVADFAAAGGAGTANCRVTLNGKVAAEFESIGSLSLYIWRSGSTAGNASGWLKQGQSSEDFAAPLTGLAWGSGQSLRIEGYSDVLRGCYLLRAGVAR